MFSITHKYIHVKSSKSIVLSMPALHLKIWLLLTACFVSGYMVLPLTSLCRHRMYLSSESNESPPSASIDAVPLAEEKRSSTVRGFGKPRPQTSNKNLKKSQSPVTSSTMMSQEITDESTESVNDKLARTAREDVERMEQERKKRMAAQAQRIADIKAARIITKENPNAGIIPDLVANRMISRMIPFFILPVAAGIGVFVYFFVLAKRYDTGFQPGMVALATQAPFAISLLGITYAILSSSWDPEEEGSPAGFEEFKTNLGSMLEGLRRTSERQEMDDNLEQEERRMRKAQRRRKRNERGDFTE